MPSIQEIRGHIRSVQETWKITNAMYLISSNNLRKARKQLADSKPYFEKVETTITDILHYTPNMSHPFVEPGGILDQRDRTVGYVVITGDKGLAGAYNHNVLKIAEKAIARSSHCRLFPIGQVGLAWFRERNIPIELESEYTAQSPNLPRARSIARYLLEEYYAGRLDEIRVIYTEMVTPLKLEPKNVKLLPLDPKSYPWKPIRRDSMSMEFTYVPSAEVVLTALVPYYLTGMMFSVLVESYCSEQQARMSAMDSSTKNARDLLRKLNLEYNRARQAAITQEITEVVGGAQASGR